MTKRMWAVDTTGEHRVVTLAPAPFPPASFALALLRLLGPADVDVTVLLERRIEREAEQALFPVLRVDAFAEVEERVPRATLAGRVDAPDVARLRDDVGHARIRLVVGDEDRPIERLLRRERLDELDRGARPGLPFIVALVRLRGREAGHGHGDDQGPRQEVHCECRLHCGGI